MYMANEGLRGYRRGIPYRNGDIKVEDFLKEFKFSNVVYKDSYTESDRKRYLNYSYDAFKDLCSVLNMPSEIISLNDSEDKHDLVFGINNKGAKNLILNKKGRLVRNWVYFLDKFLGRIVNNNDGSFCNSVTSEMSDKYSQALRPVLQVLKYKEQVIDETKLTSERLESLKKDIYDLIDKLPFKEHERMDIVALLEDARLAFLNNLTKENLEKLANTFESNGLNIDAFKADLEMLLHELNEEYKELRNRSLNTDLVNTDFYLTAVKKNTTEKTNKYTTNLELFVCAVEFYVNDKLKKMSSYNNYLINQNELMESPINEEEAVDIYRSLDNFFAVVIPMVSESIVITNEETESQEEISKNIDKVISEDKGKFKLTLFKKLAKEAGLKVDLSKSEKTETGVYYIYFTDGYVKYIKPHIYNNPAEKNHCINVYCGVSGDTKHGYLWDNELNYNDLVQYLVKLEDENRKEGAKGVAQKVSQEIEKFKLTEFKNACSKLNLKVDKSETPTFKYEQKYNIKFNKSYILYMVTPIYIDISSNKEQKIKIKTLREEIYHTWIGKLNYQELLNKLCQIELEGQKVLKEEKEEMLKAKQKLEKEKLETMKEYQRVMNERNKKEEAILSSLMDCSSVKTSKDLREKMISYIQMNKITLGYPCSINAVETVLKNNVFNIDGVELQVSKAIIPEKELKGNSRAWTTTSNNQIVLQNRVDNRKQVEALIEGFVYLKLNNKNYSKVQKEMFRESLTFMCCKMMGMDVRTYCNSDLFERFIKSGASNISTYLNKSIKLFNALLVYFR